MDSDFEKFREPCVAGMFYPASVDKINACLRQMISDKASDIEISPDDDILCAILPHAGWVYSGKTAGEGFRIIRNLDFEDAIFIGVDHRSGISSMSLWPGGGYRTPLGDLLVNKKVTESFLKHKNVFTTQKLQHTSEHSIEVLVPFFQYLFPEKKAAFISVGAGANNWSSLATALIKEIKTLPGRTLLIVSTDLSHFHSKGRAAKLDKLAIDNILNLDVQSLLSNAKAGATELCGLNGILAAMELMNKASGKTSLVDYTDSSEVSGDLASVVGYASIIIRGSKTELGGY